jgi:adenylate cyclase class 2
MNDKIEVERKRQLPDDGAQLAALLVELGWQASEPVMEVDTYYSRPDVDFMVTVECLRVRRRGDFSEITYKPASNATTHSGDDLILKQETNVVLQSAGQAEFADRLLESIGMRLLVRVEKRRRTWQRADHPDVIVAIDTVTGVGTFIETEVLAEDAVGAAALVERIEKELDLTDYSTIDLPYRDLAMSVSR